MRASTRALLAFFLIGGCTNPVQGDRTPVAVELAAKPSGPAQACVPVTASEALNVMPDGSLGIRAGRTLWINEAGKTCKDIRPMSTLIVERHGSQICRGDHVRAVEFSGGIPGPICILGNFVPYRED